MGFTVNKKLVLALKEEGDRGSSISYWREGQTVKKQEKQKKLPNQAD